MLEIINYGNSFEIETDEAEDISSVALIRPSVTTHCVNVDQRYVGLEFSIAKFKYLDNFIFLRIINIIPPGYYMIFILNKDKIPSIAKFVNIT